MGVLNSYACAALMAAGVIVFGTIIMISKMIEEFPDVDFDTLLLPFMLAFLAFAAACIGALLGRILEIVVAFLIVLIN